MSSRDPFFMGARFPSVCKCGRKIRKGDYILYWPVARKACCVVCGEAKTRQFLTTIDFTEKAA